MNISPSVTKCLRNRCYCSVLVTDVSLGGCSCPLSSPEEIRRKPKRRRCFSSVAFWIIGAICGVIIVCGNEGVSGLPLGRNLGNPIYFRSVTGACSAGHQWMMIDNGLVSKEGSFLCSSTQDTTTPSEAEALPFKHEQPYSLKRRRKVMLKISTFNLLAPCYKRVVAPPLPPSLSRGPAHRRPFSLNLNDEPNSFNTRGALKSDNVIPPAVKLEKRPSLSEGGGSGIGANLHFSRESEFKDLWQTRACELVDFIKETLAPESDIICFQEWWFDTGFENIFQSKLLESFSFHTFQRTGLKMDGLAILLKRGKEGWKVIASSRYSLGRIGNRVALLLHLQRGEEGDKSSSPVDMILCNTHLSFPHSEFDRALQKKQVEKLVNAIESYVKEQGLPSEVPRVVCGDFNLEESDGACIALRDAGYVSIHSWCKEVHEGDNHMVTHHTHRGEQVRVDHVWVKVQAAASSGNSAACVRELTLLPRNMDSRRWCDDFQFSDHRPLYTCIDIDIASSQ